MQPEQIIQQFYQAFAEKRAEDMVAHYHDEVVFRDPGFGELKGEQAKDMWRMLIERGGASLNVSFSDVHGNGDQGQAKWEATYVFGPKKRPVHNRIQASFQFQDGKIIRHTDQFNMWRWSRQALGLPGLLLGWTPFLQNQVQGRSRSLLKKYRK
ncbi:MAG: nuclear transport factor 2 family protein [Bacteroidota bacterium]